MPRIIQAAFVIVVVGGLGAGGYYLFHKRPVNQADDAVHAGWTRFDTACRVGNDAEMQAALSDILAADPGNDLAASRKRALDTGNGDATDAPILLLTLQMGLRNNRLADAHREANKLLVHRPHDWLAHCARAAYFLSVNDRASAVLALDKLPSPADDYARIQPAGLLLTFQLFRATGRDVGPLRAFVQGHAIPTMRSPAVNGLSGRDKVVLVECYLEGFEVSVAQPVAVQQGWAASARHLDNALAEALEAKDLNMLKRLALLSPRLDAGLRALARSGQVTPEQLKDLSQELEDRTRRAWQTVQDADPASPESYRGLALSYLRAGGLENYKLGREQVAKGLVATREDDPDLGLLFSRMLQLEGRPLEAYQALKATAEQNPTKPVWWALAAEAAAAARERGLALEAWAKVRRASPDNRWALRAEAKLWLDSGNANQAVQLLKPLGDAALARDAQSARTYARALAESGQDQPLGEFLKAVEREAVAANRPALAAAALRGWVDAPPTGARAAAVVRHAERLLERWPEQTELLILRAEALARVAEWGEPAWESRTVRTAILAFDRLRAREPQNRAVAFALARLRLTGENQPAQAFRDAEPLLSAANDAETTALELELIGALYHATEKPADAVRTLERAVRRPDATAGCWTQLALAYLALGKTPDARQAIEQARGRPRTPREQVEYVAAARDVVRLAP